jgi:hypothetical protein
MRIQFRHGPLLAAFALLTGAATAVSASPIVYSPTPYLQAADSPFSGLSFSYFYLETFQDGFNTPGVAASNGVVNAPNMFVDAVDAVAGVINGSGSPTG